MRPGLMAPSWPHAPAHGHAAHLQMRGFRTDRLALSSRASGESGNAEYPTFRLSSRCQSKALPCNVLINLPDLTSRCSPRHETSRKNRGVFHARGRLTFAGRLRVISVYRQPLITISPPCCRRALNSHYLVIQIRYATFYIFRTFRRLGADCAPRYWCGFGTNIIPRFSRTYEGDSRTRPS